VAVDGVISIDPVALSYILEAVGPVEIDSHIQVLADGLPNELTSKNVVKTLLSDVYANIPEPKLQDDYFAAVSSKIFEALSAGKANSERLLEGIGRGVEDRRILLWSARASEQSVLHRYSISGSISGPSVSPSEFGVYFNDGTGAKMDFYMKRSVQLVKTCERNGYSQVKVRVTSTNTAPAEAESSLPSYVTGDGAFGIKPGSVQTNIVAYGPTQAHIEEATQDGVRIPFNSQIHDDRPVGTVTTLLKPGQSTTVEFSFDKIVQNTEPALLVTPTTDPVKKVVMATVTETCNSGK
jgi:hypothetical protein